MYSLDGLLSQFGTSPLFHVQFYLLPLDLHTDFSGGRYSGMVVPSLYEFSTVCCDPHSQRLPLTKVLVNEAELDAFSGILLLFL